MKELKERLIEMKRYPNVRLNTEDSKTLAEAADAIEALIAENEKIGDLWTAMKASRDEYQKAADKMAIEHKLERDTLRQQLAEAQRDAEFYLNALNGAANSLYTIEMLAGLQEYGNPPITNRLKSFLEVRGYAKKRAMVAFTAMKGAV